MKNLAIGAGALLAILAAVLILDGPRDETPPGLSEDPISVAEADGALSANLDDSTSQTGIRDLENAADGSIDDVVVGNMAAEEPNNLDINPGGVITGRVYDAVTGAGVAGVVIDLKTALRDKEPIAVSQPTDEAGAYVIRGLAGGRYYSNRTTPEGYQHPPMSSELQFLSLPEGETLDNIDFQLLKEVPLAGIVVDESQRPVEGATVTMAGGTYTFVSGRAETAEDGAFSFHGLPQTGDVWIRASKGEHLRAGPMELRLRAEGINDLELVLSEASTVTGIVVNNAGTPLGGVLVVALAALQSRVEDGATTETGVDGLFTLTGLVPGNYKVILRDAGGTYHWSDSDSGYDLKLSKGEHIQNLSLMYAGSYTISGFVLDDGGNPLEGFRVRTGYTITSPNHTSGQDKTDANGWFELQNLGDGRYLVVTLRFSNPRAMVHVKNVEAGRDDVVLVIPRGASAKIVGSVVDAVTGEPIGQFELYSGGWAGSWEELAVGNGIEWEPMRDPDGRFSVSRTRMGFAQVAARARGYATVIKGFELRDGEDITNVVLALPPAEDLTGVVEDTGGKPVAGAYIFYGYAHAEILDRSSAVTDAAGWFELESFPAEDQRITAYHPNFAPETIVVASSHVRAQPLHLTLSSGGAIEGIVSIHEGPIKMVEVEIKKEFRGPSFGRVTLGNDGKYRFENVPATETELLVSIQYHDDTRRIVGIPVLVENGKTTVVDLTVVDAAGVVEGVVKRDKYEIEFPPNLLATLDTATGREYYSAVVGEDGSYRLEHIAAGTGTLQVTAIRWSEGHVEATVSIDLGDGEKIQRDFDIRQ